MLHGLSSPPQPKGPHKIGGAKPGPIDFKNPFFDACDFTVRLDNPCFTTAVKNPVKIDVINSISNVFMIKITMNFFKKNRVKKCLEYRFNLKLHLDRAPMEG